MDHEKFTNEDLNPSRSDVRDAVEQFPNSLLLARVDGLGKQSFMSLYQSFNMGDFVFNDFGLYEDEGGSVDEVIILLTRLDEAEGDTERKDIVNQIAKIIKN